jgi:lysophospholipase L1-like esterase
MTTRRNAGWKQRIAGFGLAAFLWVLLFQNIASARLLVVMGSSVALGYGSGPTTNYYGSYPNGYAGLLTSLLISNGWSVTNISIGGQNTGDALSRFQTDLLPLAPNQVLLGYSLANEGLAESSDPAATVNTFLTHLTNLVSECLSNGIYPILGHCYPDNLYTATQNVYLEAANLTLEKFKVPGIDFLGTVDDGNGHWVDGYSYDSLHPNNAGHLEMFYGIVPSLCDAIAAGKTNPPTLALPTRFARLRQDTNASAPLTFTPSNTVHSFTVAFHVRSVNSGTVAAVRSGTNYATIEIRADKLVYVSTNGQEISISVNATNGSWHDVVLAGHYALAKTQFIVDGIPAGSLAEQIVPDQFILGGPAGASTRPPTPAVADFQNWCVCRAAWNTNQAMAQLQGNCQQASMDICATLDDRAFAAGSPVTNRAQSLALAIVNTSKLAAMSPPPPQLATPTNGVASIQFFGTPGFNYIVQTATNLSGSWQAVSTNTPGADGSWIFTDSNATNRQEYYRIISP